MNKKFQKCAENFNCENCGTQVTGDGYTNHCPHCLYSKHVDINPGDRQETCRGLMVPVALQRKNGELKILQRCKVCGHERLNRSSPADNFEEVIKLKLLP